MESTIKKTKIPPGKSRGTLYKKKHSAIFAWAGGNAFGVRSFMGWTLLTALCTVAGCTSSSRSSSCVLDTDCGEGLVCSNGTCTAVLFQQPKGGAASATPVVGICDLGCQKLYACGRYLSIQGVPLSVSECAALCVSNDDQATALCISNASGCDQTAINTCLSGAGAASSAGGSTGVGGNAATGGTIASSTTGGIPATGGSSAATLDASIQRLAQAECSTMSRCAPELLIAFYGTTATCQTNALKLFQWLYALPGETVTGPSLGTCAAAYEAMTCADWNSTARTVPSSCIIAGSRAVGASCITDEQCTTAFCAVADYFSCGTCQPRPTVGTTCSKQLDCGGTFGLVCSNAGRCVTPGSTNAVCNVDSQPCESATHTCVNGTCQLRRTSAGQSCGAALGYADCSYLNYLYCTSAGTCSSFTVAATGQSCAGAAICAASGQCVSGLCQPAAAVGAACNNESGPWCMWPNECTSAGVCVGPPATYTCG